MILIKNSIDRNKKSFNLLFWIEMYFGLAIMISLYLTEFYAREKLDSKIMWEKYGILQTFFPRTLYLIWNK